MNSIKARIARLRQLYKDYCDLQVDLVYENKSIGFQAAAKRESVFLKEKIIKGLKDLKEDIQPDYLFEVVLSDYHHTYRILVKCLNTEEVKLYINTLEALENKPIKIHSIEKIATTEILL